MAFRNFFDRTVTATLQRAVNDVVTTARANASWSQNIPNNISPGTVQKTSTGYEVTIQVKGGQAIAFEKGSGLHGERGQTYEIKPVNAGALAFHWNPANPAGAMGSRKFLGFADDGRWLFSSVDHPGVEARPFIQPAIDSHRNDLLNRVLGIFSKAYREAFFKVEVIK